MVNIRKVEAELWEIATQLDLLRLMQEDDDTVNDTVKAVAPQLSKSEQTVLNAISTYPNYSYEKLATYCQFDGNL